MLLSDYFVNAGGPAGMVVESSGQGRSRVEVDGSMGHLELSGFQVDGWTMGDWTGLVFLGCGLLLQIQNRKDQHLVNRLRA